MEASFSYNFLLDLSEISVIADVSSYRSIVGDLQYLTMTRHLCMLLTKFASSCTNPAPCILLQSRWLTEKVQYSTSNTTCQLRIKVMVDIVMHINIITIINIVPIINKKTLRLVIQELVQKYYNERNIGVCR